MQRMQHQDLSLSYPRAPTHLLEDHVTGLGASCVLSSNYQVPLPVRGLFQAKAVYGPNRPVWKANWTNYYVLGG